MMIRKKAYFIGLFLPLVLTASGQAQTGAAIRVVEGFTSPAFLNFVPMETLPFVQIK